MEPEDTRNKETIVQRVVNGIAVARLFKKQGDLMGKMLTFAVQILLMLGATFYAAANSATSTNGLSSGQPQGGIMFLYSLAIAAAWVILLIVVQIVDDRNVVVAGKVPLILALMGVLVIVFLGVIIGAIVALGAALVGAGTAIGYFFLTWFLTEIVQGAAVAVQYQMSPKHAGISLGDDEEDEYADSRGTFQGVDESVAVRQTNTSDMEKGDDEFAGLTEDDAAGPGEAGDDDLGLL